MRQYIGARYTIKVYENSQDPSSAEWESGASYERLVMVTYLNSSYLSKKDVPQNIGNPADNPEYWVVTGYYNGQIASLQTQIDDLNALIGNVQTDVNTKLSDILNKVENKVIFIGDSYARNTTRDGVYVYGWIYNLINNLGFTDAVSLVSDVAGKTATGFSTYDEIGESFLHMLQTYVDTLTTDEKDKIGTICVCGGGNDDVSSAATLNQYIEEFCTYVHDNLPNAKVFVGFIYSDIRSTTNYVYVNNARFSYHNAIQYGAFYLHGVDYILHNYAQRMDEEGHHPNNSGTLALARGIKSALLTGYTDTFMNKRTVQCTPVTGLFDSDDAFNCLTQNQNDAIIECTLNAFGRNLASAITVTTGTNIVIGTVPMSLIRPGSILGETIVRFYDSVAQEAHYISCAVTYNSDKELVLTPRGDVQNVLRINLYATKFFLIGDYE